MGAMMRAADTIGVFQAIPTWEITHLALGACVTHWSHPHMTANTHYG